MFGCAFSDLVFRLPREEVQQKIYDGEYDFLREIDYQTDDAHDAERLHAGGRYYLSQIYRTLQLDVLADDFLSDSWKHDATLWRYQAGLKILARLSKQKQYGRMLPIAANGVRTFQNDLRYLYYYLEALYWQDKYSPLLNLLPTLRLQIEFEQTYPTHRVRWYSGEAQLWEAVSRYRARRAGSVASFRELFFNYSASEYHTRAYLYIMQEARLRNRFSAWELAFFNAKHLTATRSYVAATQAYEEAFNTLPSAQYDAVLTQRTIRDIGRSYLYGELYHDGQEQLHMISAHLIDRAQYATALEWRGRLLTQAQQYTEAQQTLHVAYRASASDRILWLIFDAAFSASISDGIASAEEYGALIRNPRYYSDLFERQISLALRERRWTDFWRLRSVIVRYGASTDRARVAVIAAEAVRVGVAYPPRNVSRAELRAELNFAREQGGSYYYAHIASFLLGEDVVPAQPTFSYSGEEKNGLTYKSCSRLVEGYFQFALIEQGYKQLQTCATRYPTGELIEIANDLYTRAVFNYAIRVLDIARRREEFTLDESTARILYPQAYADLMDEIAERNNLPRYFFYATIREESYFTPDISSHAGAVGLGQFIPATARAVARRMRLPDPDLTNPEHNLMLSGFHLRELIDTLENKPVFALAGYNAGVNRARRWLRENSDYSAVLQHEAIPFYETRHYVRKIVVTNILYERVYRNNLYMPIVKQYFADLGQF